MAVPSAAEVGGEALDETTAVDVAQSSIPGLLSKRDWATRLAAGSLIVALGMPAIVSCRALFAARKASDTAEGALSNTLSAWATSSSGLCS